MNLEVSEKVFAFTVLLYSQQLFIQMFNPEADNEWKKIQPILKEMYKALSEENRQKGYEKALKWGTTGWSTVKMHDFNDLWYVMYCISNYRINWVELSPEQDREELKILRFALINVAKKSHKRYSEYRSRHI